MTQLGDAVSTAAEMTSAHPAHDVLARWLDSRRFDKAMAMMSAHHP